MRVNFHWTLSAVAEAEAAVVPAVVPAVEPAQNPHTHTLRARTTTTVKFDHG